MPERQPGHPERLNARSSSKAILGNLAWRDAITVKVLPPVVAAAAFLPLVLAALFLLAFLVVGMECSPSCLGMAAGLFQKREVNITAACQEMRVR
ncbi:MAG TPA: hypothetical protein VGB17_04815 [Pyrinomonadaceae bacterium]|jgi:hypothetical protein